jgi:hypothetical protein
VEQLSTNTKKKSKELKNLKLKLDKLATFINDAHNRAVSLEYIYRS